ncbi:MAG TPA: hypothetical protein VFW37_07190 [Alphaproteobacteria bacterium]|nr:hypothetical protein [Alphaproteobacteria bacterium]
MTETIVQTTDEAVGTKPVAQHDTIIEYMYRDAGNYKFYGRFCIAGILTMKAIEPYLLDGEYFVPTEIGVPSLVPEQMNGDDHLLHEFVSFSYSDSKESVMNKVKFIRLIRKAHKTGWFNQMIRESLKDY